MVDIMSVNQLLLMNLKIPDYQRPYKWVVRNIQELLDDINNAIKEAEKFKIKFKYRIGTIILHKEGNGRNKSFNIVDGQQRIISLVMLKFFLDNSFNCSILNYKFKNKISQRNINNNYNFIKEWFELINYNKNKNIYKQFSNALENILEVVVIQVDKISEAFQLFDSQNTRGRALVPHDLLKAYHLREMKNYQYELEYIVTKWESKNTSNIRDLFDLFLFPIWNWSRKNKSRPFTIKEIDTYKGISEKSGYSYAKRTNKAMPYFQITEPFIAGSNFFKFVEYYLNLCMDIKTEIEKNEEFSKIKECIEMKNHSVGFGYVKNLFYCVLLMYYDKFHNFDITAVKKLFTWSFMIRVDMQNLGFDSINKYAIGEENDKYTNNIAVFSKISLARVHTEISNLQIKVLREPDDAVHKNWSELYIMLKKINGLMEEDDE